MLVCDALINVIVILPYQLLIHFEMVILWLEQGGAELECLAFEVVRFEVVG